MSAGTMALVAGPLVCGPAVGMTATSAARRPSALALQRKSLISTRTLICRAEGEDQQPSTSQQETKPAAPQVEDEEPIWVRRERERELMAKEGPGDLPFGVYLIGSAIVAIAAIGSIFEYTAKNPIFDIIEADSPLYTPILGLFAITGLPTAGYLFYKSVDAANKEAERMDKIDGYKN